MPCESVEKPVALHAPVSDKRQATVLPWSMIVPAFLATGMLLLGLENLPYSYYQLLRLAVTGIAAWLALQSYSNNEKPASCVFIAIALILNPILPFRFAKETWHVVDGAAAIAIAGAAASLLWRKPVPRVTRWMAACFLAGVIVYVIVRFGIGFDVISHGRVRRR
jgi:hypothetical protein